RGFGWRFPVAGGGYFRLLPYSVTSWALRHLNQREGQPAMVYLHPWEIDPDQPRLPVGHLASFRHLAKSGTTAAKLRRLIREFRFAPARNVLTDAGALMAGGAP
ncbi:MAG TPA: DUF3473 domain-containing protein, partial [Candidatus Eisenbacteria bacterium]|nr:DUF3473 domain-containing protein [Candidatus Eisenbacteria bacterium]